MPNFSSTRRIAGAVGDLEADWQGPYLHAEPVAACSNAVYVSGWSGAPTRRISRATFGALRCADMSPLAAVPGCGLFSLQFGSHAPRPSPHRPACLIEDLTVGCRDFAGTAAAIASLDLTISIDTATANLAGAMGAPVWVPLPFVSDLPLVSRRHAAQMVSPARNPIDRPCAAIGGAYSRDGQRSGRAHGGAQDRDRREGERVGW
jgi:hypothetical protein